MNTINITGKIGQHDISLTIKSSANGRQVAEFVVDFYNGLLIEAPGFMTSLQKHLPTLVDAGLKMRSWLLKFAQETEARIEKADEEERSLDFTK